MTSGIQNLFMSHRPRAGPPRLKYLQGISSDGEVLSVSDFDALDSIQNSLLGQLSCQV